MAFKNIDHWRELKGMLLIKPHVLASIRDLLGAYGAWFSGNMYEQPSSVRRLAFGSIRDVYRIERTPVVLAGKPITLSVKMPSFSTCSWARYKAETELDQRSLFDHERCMLDYEARAFDKLAAGGANVPWVTGIVAGYGIIGTLTEDISSKRCSSLEFIVSRKFTGDCAGVETSYFAERLQVDR